MGKKILQTILLIYVAVNSIYASVQNFYSTINMSSRDSAVDRFEERLQNLTENIPFQRGKIGYFANEDMPSMAFNADDAAGEYTLAQYAVAPLILVRGTDQEWNILNLTPDAYDIWSKEHGNRYELISSGGNLYLIHKLGK